MNSPIDADSSSKDTDPELRQSGLGVASFTLSLIAGVATIVMVGYAGYVETATPGGVAGDGSTAALIGLAIIACLAMLLVGIVLGVIGLFLKGRRRTFAAIGVGINGLFVILIGVLMWIGLSQG